MALNPEALIPSQGATQVGQTPTPGPTISMDEIKSFLAGGQGASGASGETPDTGVTTDEINAFLGKKPQSPQPQFLDRSEDQGVFKKYITQPLADQGALAAAVLNRGLGGFSQHLDEISNLLVNTLGHPEWRGGAFEAAKNFYMQNAEYWDSKAQNKNLINQTVAEFIGGAAPGMVEFMLGIPYAAATGYAEGGLKGAISGGAERALMGQLLHVANVLKRPTRVAAMGTIGGVQAAAHGGSPEEIARSAGTMAGFGLFGGPGQVGISDIFGRANRMDSMPRPTVDATKDAAMERLRQGIQNGEVGPAEIAKIKEDRPDMTADIDKAVIDLVARGVKFGRLEVKIPPAPEEAIPTSETTVEINGVKVPPPEAPVVEPPKEFSESDQFALEKATMPTEVVSPRPAGEVEMGKAVEQVEGQPSSSGAITAPTTAAEAEAAAPPAEAPRVDLEAGAEGRVPSAPAQVPSEAEINQFLESGKEGPAAPAQVPSEAEINQFLEAGKEGLAAPVTAPAEAPAPAPAPPVRTKSQEKAIQRIEAILPQLENSVQAYQTKMSDKAKRATETAWNAAAIHARRAGLEVPKIGTFFSADEYLRSAQNLRDQIVGPQAPESQPVPPAEAVTPEQQQAAKDQSVQEGRIVESFPVSDLVTKPEVLQFKRGMGEGGVSSKMKNIKVWDSELGGLISVWRNPDDGKAYVVNGHHRYDLAKRAGTENVAVRFIQAGTEKEAAFRGALINIAEGQGTPIDAALVFRSEGVTPEKIEGQYGISLKGKVAREGMALSQLNPAIFGMVQREEFPMDWGVVIGERVPAEAQPDMLRLVKKLEDRGKKITPSLIEQMANEAAGAPTQTETQETLFGPQAFERPLLTERAELRDYASRELGRNKSAFATLANASKATTLSNAGVAKEIQVEQSKTEAQRMIEAQTVFNRMGNMSGPINDTLNSFAEELSRAKSNTEASAIKKRFFDRILEVVPEALGRANPSGPEGVRGDEGGGLFGPGEAGGLGQAAIQERLVSPEFSTVLAGATNIRNIAADVLRSVAPSKNWKDIHIDTVSTQELTELIREGKMDLTSLAQQGIDLNQATAADIAGASFTGLEKSVILMADKQTRLEAFRTAAHEAVHVAMKWLLPETDYNRLMKWYEGNPEQAAIDGANFFLKEKGMVSSPPPPPLIRRIFMKFRDALNAISSGLSGRGFKSPQDIFGRMYGGEYQVKQAPEIIRGRLNTGAEAAVKPPDKFNDSSNISNLNTAFIDDFMRILGEKPGKVEEAGPASPVQAKRTEMEQAAAAAAIENRGMMTEADRNRLFSGKALPAMMRRWIRPDGMIDPSRVFRDTGIDVPVIHSRDLSKYLSWIYTPFGIGETGRTLKPEYEPIGKFFSAVERRNGASSQSDIAARKATNDFYSLSHSIRAPVEDALHMSEFENVLYSNKELAERFKLSPEQIKGFWAARNTLTQHLNFITTLRLTDILPEEVSVADVSSAVQRYNRGRSDRSMDTADNFKWFSEDLKKSIGLDTEMMDQVKDLADWAFSMRTYLPHTWHSAWVVRVDMPDGRKYMYEVPTPVGKFGPTHGIRTSAARRAAIATVKDKLGLSDAQIKDLVAQKKLFVQKTAQIPMDLFQGTRRGSMESISQAAFDKVWKKYEKTLPPGFEGDMQKLKGDIKAAMDEMYMGKGWGRHLMQRTGVLGYRENIAETMAEYLTGFNAWTAKRQFVEDAAKIMGEIDPTKTPNVWKYAREYVSDMTAPSSQFSEARPFKQLASLYSLALDTSNAVLNLTQNATHGLSALRLIESPGSPVAEVELARATKDAMAHYFGIMGENLFNKTMIDPKTGKEVSRPKTELFSKPGYGLKEDEIGALRWAYEQGKLDPAQFGEVSGFHKNKIYMNYVDKGFRSLYFMFTGAEALNRTSTFVAAFRRAKRAGMKDAAEVASNAVLTAHFPYGKSNRPLWVRRTGAFGNAAYTFMTYQMANLSFLKRLGEMSLYGETPTARRNAMKALGSNLAYTFALGGLVGTPFSWAAKAIYNLFTDPEDDIEKLLHKYAGIVGDDLGVPKVVSRGMSRAVVRGIPAMFGADQSWKIQGTDVAGLPIGVEMTKNIQRRWERGREALSQGDYSRAFFIASPDFLMNPYKAFFDQFSGTGAQGAGPIQYTPTEKVIKATGMTPTRESEAYAAQDITRKKYQERTDMVGSLSDQYMEYTNKRSPKVMQKLLDRLKDYNEKETRKGKNGTPIYMKEVLESAKRKRAGQQKPYEERFPRYMRQFREEQEMEGEQ